MGREFNLCGYMTKEDIAHYAEMIVILESGFGGKLGKFKEFLSDYGKDVKQIQKNIGDHLKQCILNNKYYQEESLVFSLIYMIGIDLGTPELKALHEQGRQFGIEHLTYDDPEGLEEYISGRARAEVVGGVLKVNQRFEEHSIDCDSCQKYYDNRVRLFRMLKEDPDEK